MISNPSNESSSDPIIEEIHQTREQLLDEYGGDLRAYFEAVRHRQKESGKLVVSHPKRSESLPGSSTGK